MYINRNYHFYFPDEIEKISIKMDKLGSEMIWIKNALSEFREAVNSGEFANALLEKYSKGDEKRASV